MGNEQHLGTAGAGGAREGDRFALAIDLASLDEVDAACAAAAIGAVTTRARSGVGATRRV